MCQQFNLGRCNNGAERYFVHKCWVTGCGGDTPPPRPAHVLHQWLTELQQAHTTLQHSNVEHKLRLHPDKAWVTWLLDGIDNGVSIDYTGSVSPLRSHNPIFCTCTSRRGRLQTLAHSWNHHSRRQSAKHPDLMQLLRTLFLVAAQHSFNIRLSHLPGRLNSIADALSRKNLPLFFTLAPQADPQLTPIPRHLTKT